ncbi:MAG: hypothetical protein JWO05_3779 [Gemmatimonadetes bacterium]|nr:hypothetical protein [Gemmatimonadota bacterium]
MQDSKVHPNLLDAPEPPAAAAEDASVLQDCLQSLQPDTLFALRTALARFGAAGDPKPLEVAAEAYARDMRVAGHGSEEALNTLRRLLIHIPEMRALQHDLRHRQAERVLADLCRAALLAD